MAEYFGVPESIRRKPPSTDTYSLSQGQDEFFFSVPFQKLDLCLYAKNNNIAAESVASVIGLTKEQVERIFQDIDRKGAATRYLHLSPQLLAPVKELDY